MVNLNIIGRLLFIALPCMMYYTRFSFLVKQDFRILL
ncbi:hypothetical protein FAEPRAM212_02087 [Faecalibacterium prausnitzii M21/2]|uniref:Uncharacterized protein n=1 Tax=Faecalibacterium prausnitzii M21/2 TaxID=411485 RepID=A8SCX0_9FIRM|nr:hypothetical protein FAEPRAM212_02087 [Faecalibacterium prausnitzii M21/2]